MGQASSRNHSSFRSPVTSPPSSQPHSVSDAGLVSTTRRSRRESLRRSFLNLVKPTPRDHRRSFRKSWRQSRRWSKAPTVEDNSSTDSSPVPFSPTTTPPSHPLPLAGKNKDLQSGSDDVEEESDYSSTSAPAMSSDNDPVLSGSTIFDLNEREDDHSAEIEPTLRDESEAVIAPSQQQHPSNILPSVSHEEPSNTSIASPESPSPMQQQAPASETPASQFPPPGTLVVVQGVVHTTDAPRPSAPSPRLEEPSPTRPSSTPPTTHNRLSSLLHSRPSSMIGSRPPSFLGSAPASSAAADSFSTNEDVSSLRTSPPIDVDSHSNAPEHVPTDSNPGVISSGSIDVLGTLLSVAAAATAASLLTGTSEPLLIPSTLASHPPYNNNIPSSSTADATRNTERPTSPTPTAGLGTGSLDVTRSERLRQAWSSIRERLGSRPAPLSPGSPPGTSSSPFDSSPSSATSSDTRSASVESPDPREQLLGQMAQAFSLGLGLATETTHAPSTSDADGGNADRIVGSGGPAEGSFERFLVDLQTDLRTALTNPTMNTDRAGSAATSGSSENAVDIGTSELIQRQGQASESVQVSTSDIDAELRNEDNSSEIPSLDEASNSEESDFEDAQEDVGSADTDERVTIRSPSQADSPSIMADTNQILAQTSLQPSGPTTPDVDEQGRINWWRLYRFAPVNVPPNHAQLQHEAHHPRLPTSAASSPLATPVNPSFSSPADTTLPELLSPNADTPSSPTTSQPLRILSVVPVIVVGVQSVNPAGNDGGSPFVSGADHASTTTPTNFPASADAPELQQSQQGQQGTRGWPSRAADVIRNLRPGRRNRSVSQASGPGSRTFLIYVIGGYYPPNHSILNGGPDTLASLEALLELADLLGHAKPPTASREDIEKSGLEVINPSQLKQYENELKISSNCIERCLICLDDYQEEDNIRVMKCRHAFHQNCVDKWLETGRNNCPACRSKGVNVDDV